MFSLESPQRGDSNEYTQYTISQYEEKKIILNHPKFATIGFDPKDQKRVRNSRGKRAISVRAIEVLLYMLPPLILCMLQKFNYHTAVLFATSIFKHSRMFRSLYTFRVGTLKYLSRSSKKSYFQKRKNKGIEQQGPVSPALCYPPII